MDPEDDRELTERDWRRLAQTIQRGTCIALLGPGVAVDPQDPEGSPLAATLAGSIAEELRPDTPVANRDDLQHVAQLHYQQFHDRVGLEMLVEDFYAPYADQTTALHRELSALPFTLCLNTTPDPFLCNAFRQAGKTPQQDYYHFRRGRTSNLAESGSDRPIVYDLYGSLQEPDSLVITENDLLEFLVNVIKGTPPLPPFIVSRFSDPSTSFLFLGFGFQRWYQRILLHVLRAHGHRSRSLALENAAFFSHPDRSRMALFFSQQHLIEFRRLSWQGFVEELRCRHDAFSAAEAQVAAQPPEGAPKVFLCHSHLDRDRVADLARELQARGVAVWLDRQNLRGGDNWERLIPHVIDKQVDYVVVLQSPNMRGKVESYFHKEINAALERQKGFADEFRFVIPALLAPCEVFDKLSQWHVVDLSGPEGVAELAEAVKDDWRQRHD